MCFADLPRTGDGGSYISYIRHVQALNCHNSIQEPVKVFQSLSLLHVGVEGEGF